MIKKLYFDFIIIPIFRILDFFIVKNNNYWAFSVHHIKSDQFIENQRAIYEEVKNNKSLKKIIFTRDNSLDFQLENYNNTIIVRIDSIKGLFLLTRCKVILLTHSISMDLSIRYGKKLFSVIKPRLSNRIIVNMWHGIPLKKLLSLTNENIKKTTNRVRFNTIERAKYTGLISSSDIDSYSMSAMFYPVKYQNIWITGLPRNDFLLKNEDSLPQYIKTDIEKIRKIKKDKKLIVYAPTYRQTHIEDSASYYQFTEEEIFRLKSFLKKNNAIFGFRMHYFRNSDKLFNMEEFIDNKYFFDLGHKNIKEVSSMIKQTDILITDYSGVFIDAIYTNTPVFSFAYDLENYNKKQDGVLYDLDIIFPSEIKLEFNDLLDTIQIEIDSNTQTKTEKYKLTKKFFFKYLDDNNSKRVIEKIKGNL